jgi:hypothetical protein
MLLTNITEIHDYYYGHIPITCLHELHTTCSRSRRRAAKGDKRMVLVHTHGLFITLTEFRLSTTFIPIIIIIHTTGVFHKFNRSAIYTNTSYNIYYTWRIPLALFSPCQFPHSSPLYPFYLLGTLLAVTGVVHLSPRLLVN